MFQAVSNNKYPLFFVNSTSVFAMYCLLQETDSNKETTQTIIRILNLFIANYKINCKSIVEAEPAQTMPKQSVIID